MNVVSQFGTWRAYLRQHPHTLLLFIAGCAGIIVLLFLLRNPYWWLTSCALLPFMVIAWVTWPIMRRAR